MARTNKYHSLFMWKYNLLKPGSYDYYQKLCHVETRSHDYLEDLAWQRTRRLVAEAYRHSEFYLQKYRSVGFEPGDLKDWSDFERLPPLTRGEIAEYARDIIHDGASLSNLNKVTTGGSTGEPLTVYHPRSINRAAALWRMKSWWGINPNEDYGTVYRQGEGRRKRLKDFVTNWPLTTVPLNAESIDEESIKRFIKTWNRRKPRLLHGYVGGLAELAEYIEENRVIFHAPKIIWTTSAPISSVQRRTLETNLGGAAFDQYGSCEIYTIAAEGPEKVGLRVFNDIRRVESLDENGRSVMGKEGRLHVTDLENHSFPLIRYENGDCAATIIRPVGCPHPYSLMTPVKGRVSESIRTPNGTILTGEYLTTIFDDKPEPIKQFRVHQFSDYDIEVQVVARREASEIAEQLKSVKHVLEEKLKKECAVQIRTVERIQHDRGKLRFITTDVKH